MGSKWTDSGSGPGWAADPKNDFKVTVPEPKGTEWPVLKSATEAEQDTE